jgi:hypothetical protein
MNEKILMAIVVLLFEAAKVLLLPPNPRGR